MEIAPFIRNPERLNKDTLYQLRELVAQYPYFQAARLLFLQNLFLQHDPSFGEELRRAALYIPDRRVLFRLVEGDSHQPRPVRQPAPASQPTPERQGDRTRLLIDDFLDHVGTETETPSRRKLTIADATTDYAAFLLQMEDAIPQEQPDATTRRRQDLIDDFIEKRPERIVLPDKPEYAPEVPMLADGQDTPADEDYFTETLAKIYIQQGRYEKALEIIRKLHLIYPKKNSYFADQMRFLRKLIINNRKKTS